MDEEMIKDVLEESRNENQDVKRLIESHVVNTGAPSGSFADVDILQQIAHMERIDYDDVEELREAVEEILEEDSKASTIIENNLEFFGDKEKYE